MSDSPKKDSLKSLVSAALGQSSQAPASHQDASESTTEQSPEFLGDAEALIAIYFDLEAPEERDTVFDQLTELVGPLVDGFFAEMASHDDDAYVRASATAELFKRGHANYLPAIESDLVDPQELFFFATALHSLAEVRGSELYPDLVQMLADPNRDPEHQQDIMLAMETVAPDQAVRHFAALLSGWQKADQIDDMFVEHASFAFARQSHAPGHQILQQVLKVVEQSILESNDKEELIELLNEALSVSEPEPTA